jgi:MFS family permease
VITPSSPPTLGLGANWRPFTILVVVNAFVGSMVGVERSLLPLVAERDFGLASRNAILTFIVGFGLAKAITNFFAGRLADRVGRRRVLILGWLLALPVPMLLWRAPTWSWIVAANLLLGVSQGLAWSMTVLMKVDLVGPRRRGLAMGLNEFAGYLAVGLASLGAGVLAASVGLRESMGGLGLGFAVLGLGLSVLGVPETREHARLEAAGEAVGGANGPDQSRRRARVAVNAAQAGCVNNANDGVAWGLLPLLFAGGGLDVGGVAALVSVYPTVWGLGQLGFGWLSDRTGRRPLIVLGMVVQGAALIWLARADGFLAWGAASAALGLGTAMVYPTLLAAVGDVAPPDQRGRALGRYRLWRDLGYPIGALAAGSLADVTGIRLSIGAVGAVTVTSGLVAALTMPESRRAPATAGGS